MRKLLLSAVICSLASAVVAATGQHTPLNVKPGAWQVTETAAVTGTLPTALPPGMQAALDRMPPEQRAKLLETLKSQLSGAPRTSTYKICVTREQLDKYPFSGPDEKCDWTTLNSTGSDMEAHSTSCRDSNTPNLDATVKIHVLDSEHATGSAQVSFNGQVRTNATLSGTWIGATCDPGTN